MISERKHFADATSTAATGAWPSATSRGGTSCARVPARGVRDRHHGPRRGPQTQEVLPQRGMALADHHGVGCQGSKMAMMAASPVPRNACYAGESPWVSVIRVLWCPGWTRPPAFFAAARSTATTWDGLSVPPRPVGRRGAVLVTPFLTAKTALAPCLQPRPPTTTAERRRLKPAREEPVLPPPVYPSALCCYGPGAASATWPGPGLGYAPEGVTALG